MNSEPTIPTIQVERIKEYLLRGKRIDGRGLREQRKIEVKRELSKNAESAVSVKIGETQVYCGVKMSVTQPYPDSPDAGTFMTTAELHPMASEGYEMGKPGIDAVELGRVIDRGIRESGFIDFKKLCIKEGEKVWQVFLDIVAINNDGNIFDAAGLAGLIAIADARLPKYNHEEDKIEHELTEEGLPLNEEAMSVNFTLHKIEDKIIVDPSFEEEIISDYRVSIAIADNEGEPRITAMQKGKEGAISQEELEEIMDIVKEIHKERFKELSDIIWNR